MGSPEDEAARLDDEMQHEVRLTRGFWMARTAVTQAEFGRFVEATGHRTAAEIEGTSSVWVEEAMHWEDRHSVFKPRSRKCSYVSCHVSQADFLAVEQFCPCQCV